MLRFARQTFFHYEQLTAMGRIPLLRFNSTKPRDVDVLVEEANNEFSEFFGNPVDQTTPTESIRPMSTSTFTTNASEKELSHVDHSGAAQMVDTSHKNETYREAGASARVHLSPEAFHKVKENRIKKGDVLTVSKIAGILGAKQTSALLPLCHNINLDHVEVSFDSDEATSALLVKTRVSCRSSTGVEMEALMGAAIAAMNVIDMVKAIDKQVTVTDLHLDFKKGGKSGSFTRS